MKPTTLPSQRIELNGRVPHCDELAFLAQVNYGHFTTMQVRDRQVRGFDLHLQRLAYATRVLFGSELDVAQVRAWARELVDDQPLSLRITVFSLAFDQAEPERTVTVDVLMATRSPGAPRSAALRLQSIQYERALPLIKHIGMFDLLHLRHQARASGFDDVVLSTADRQVSEGSTWNIGFWDGQRVIWPRAPALPGITQKLIDQGLHKQGIESVTTAIDVTQLSNFRGAFIINSGSIGPMVESIDSQRLEVPGDVLTMLKAAWESHVMELI